MSDKSTEGYAVPTDEVEGMLRNLCAYALSDPEPLQRYLDLTHQQVLFDGVVAAIRRERGKALADLVLMGVPLAKVAELAKLETPARAKSLITAAGVTIPVQRTPNAKKPPAPSEQRSEGSAPTRAGAPMLPSTIVPAGKRTLTQHERRALGLPDPVPITRKRSVAAT